MRRLLLGLCPLALWLAGCGPADPHDAHFKGTWQHITENGLTNAKEEFTVTISADHDHFRIVEQSNRIETVEVFDGQTLYTKMTELPLDPSAPPSGEPAKPIVSSRPMTVTQSGPLRFWSSTFTVGHAEAGGLIAGQDTLLYKVAEHRSDGDLSEQQWVDAKTGILLKSLSAVYSSQVKSLVRQETWECRTVDYAPPPESDFQKP